MLFAKPTPKGTGIELWGDYKDLTALYDTISRLSYVKKGDEAAHERNNRLLTVIQYDIRHAFQGDREIDKNIDNGEAKTTYFGCRVDWITLLYTISALRYNAAYKQTDELDQSYLYLLEYLTREALYMYDVVGAKTIEPFINNRIDVATKYVYLIHQHLTIQFFNQKPSKTRFRSIPSMLISMSEGHQELVELRHSISMCMVENKCDISQVDDMRDYTIIW